MIWILHKIKRRYPIPLTLFNNVAMWDAFRFPIFSTKNFVCVKSGNLFLNPEHFYAQHDHPFVVDYIVHRTMFKLFVKRFTFYLFNLFIVCFYRKSWHLFAPNTPLTAKRIPYEESSIYCKENFYSPTEEMKKNLEVYKDFVHHVILEPNDVLIVPKNWWHYVEAVDMSLSVNAWIPLKCDFEQQIEECIVKYLIENFVQNSSLHIKTYIVNPNQVVIAIIVLLSQYCLFNAILF